MFKVTIANLRKLAKSSCRPDSWLAIGGKWLTNGNSAVHVDYCEGAYDFLTDGEWDAGKLKAVTGGDVVTLPPEEIDAVITCRFEDVGERVTETRIITYERGYKREKKTRIFVGGNLVIAIDEDTLNLLNVDVEDARLVKDATSVTPIVGISTGGSSWWLIMPCRQNEDAHDHIRLIAGTLNK